MVIEDLRSIYYERGRMLPRCEDLLGGDFGVSGGEIAVIVRPVFSAGRRDK
jgi:hypothetical protein